MIDIKGIKMKTIDNENTIFVDCDDTLIMHDLSLTGNKVTIDFYGEPTDFIKHEEHIKLLKNYKARGFTVILWSGNGYQHAKKVAEALLLEKHVDYVMTKPYRVIDDFPPNSWAPQLYIPYS
jgi:hydroxymethylpyrimidine pyrophosphatase-like HAD family hydrolase